jgi:hypothetical protein
MTANPFAQAGFDQAGQQTGSGGSFHVARAISVGGQVVRVVFSSAPKTHSSGAPDDALNASNYQLAVVSGQGKTPQSVGVHPQPIAFPAYGIFNDGEVAIDLQSDRPLIVGMGYSVQVSDAVRAADGSSIGSPYSWNFVGSARPIVTLPQRGKMGLVDLSSDPISGGITVDASGDWAPDNGDTVGTRKRCIRRVLTSESAFVHLQGYGLYFDIKLPMVANKLGKLRTGVQSQLAQEPDVDSVATQVSADARGFLSIGMRVKTKTGQNVPTVLSVSPSGVTVE